ncbi:hypothetical protein SDC9_161237 [bioreactor metagenome]|uniref:NEAT domain-containing protein n=1 Tax=bioreactor metagenome TaxID=1076179 RepID=A0A645FHQ0_9ZZZZ|nr:hypothetical protein [Lachnospiraceae bacterium]
MKSLFKKATGFGMAAIMALSMSAMAFAAQAPGYVTFFKSGSATEVSMTQKAIASYSSKVEIGDNYVYTVNLQSFTMTKMGFTGTGYMTGIDMESDEITAVVSGDNKTLVVTVPSELVVDGNSEPFAASITAKITFLGIPMSMPSSVNLAITDSQLTYSE